MSQKTLDKKIGFSGIGIHTGAQSTVTVLPAAEHTGIRFVRTDLADRPVIRAAASNVVDTRCATTLGASGATVSTVEHLLAAFYGLGVDNAVVRVDGPEIPIMDGSAAVFAEMIVCAGLRELDAPREYVVVKRPVKVSDGESFVMILPCDSMEFSMDYSMDFAHPVLASQNFSGSFSGETFIREIAPARTYGFLSEVEMLRANGLALGGSLANALVIDDTRILNDEGLRYPDEMVRHKVLDLMGDISILGRRLIGRLVAYRSGHRLNYEFVKKLLHSADRWELRRGSGPRDAEDRGLRAVSLESRRLYGSDGKPGESADFVIF
ncbi:MAG TPA: UDP-3-O-acyl-N-acetylglucosamine deacetylase [Deltaproteobacteria bacterium]|nr:UDP-3-O-acyl-N-acetylglucosamine deacetylase [Deltaproteobacteria bacterium]